MLSTGLPVLVDQGVAAHPANLGGGSASEPHFLLFRGPWWTHFSSPGQGTAIRAREGA